VMLSPCLEILRALCDEILCALCFLCALRRENG
jgi:hypothetical protein